MIWNLALLFLVFGASKKKVNPYVAPAIFGSVKAVLYFIANRNLIVALIAFTLFAGLASAMVWLLTRVDKREIIDEPYPKYGTKRKTDFKWEYVPLTSIVVLLIFGEWMLMMFLR